MSWKHVTFSSINSTTESPPTTPPLTPNIDQSPCYFDPPTPQDPRSVLLTGRIEIHPIIGWSHNPILDYDLSLPWHAATTQVSKVDLDLPATNPPMPFLLINCRSFPWELDIICQTSAKFITIFDVLSQLHTCLHFPASEKEFHVQSLELQREISKAFYIQIHRYLQCAAEEKKCGLRQINFLKSNNRFLGLSSTKLGPHIWTLEVE